MPSDANLPVSLERSEKRHWGVTFARASPQHPMNATDTSAEDRVRSPNSDTGIKVNHQRVTWSGCSCKCRARTPEVSRSFKRSETSLKCSLIIPILITSHRCDPSREATRGNNFSNRSITALSPAPPSAHVIDLYWTVARRFSVTWPLESGFVDRFPLLATFIRRRRACALWTQVTWPVWAGAKRLGGRWPIKEDVKTS